MFPNIKKKVKILTPIISRDHAKQFSVQRLFLPFSSVALYNGMTHRKLDGMYLVGKCHVYKKYVQDSFYFVCNSIHSNHFCVLFRKHTELKILAARFYSTTPQISTDDSPSTANSAGLR